jgi:hypothetical protein
MHFLEQRLQVSEERYKQLAADIQILQSNVATSMTDTPVACRMSAITSIQNTDSRDDVLEHTREFHRSNNAVIKGPIEQEKTVR